MFSRRERRRVQERRRRHAESERELTPGELREGRWMYGTTVNFATVRIHKGKYFPFQPDDTAMAPDGHVYFPAQVYKADFSTDADGMAWLIHELAHVWQIQSGVWLKLTRIWEGDVYAYGALQADADLKTFAVEQQASIVADWWRLRHGLPPTRGSGPVGSYEAVVRRAIPAGQP